MDNLYGKTRKEIVSLGRKLLPPLSDLIAIQLNSYRDFLAKDVPAHKRENEGLQAIFLKTFPVETPNDDLVLEYVNYELGESRWSVEECKSRGLTYSLPLRVVVQVINKLSGEVREQNVYIGDLPQMTPYGTFVFNGSERVVVSQLHRSPGIFFFYDSSKRQYAVRLIPYRGSWLEFELDTKGILVARIDRKKKFSITILLRALGFATDEKILSLFYDIETLSIENLSAAKLNRFISRRSAINIKNPSTQESILYPGERINEDSLALIREMNIKRLSLLVFPEGKDDLTVINSLEKDDARDYLTALQKIHMYLRPGEPFNEENTRLHLERLFFTAEGYDLGKVGRYKINNKFMRHNPSAFKNVKERNLRIEDIVSTLRYFVNLINGVEGYDFDDIDHLGNRRVRSVGELLANQLKVGFARMERVAKERMVMQDVDAITPQALISMKPIAAAINEFFGSSQLSQFMDQTNPLSEITHKRRLSALGTGGISRDRAGFEVRDIHYSHYGRMCPIETPEGPNIGLIVSMGTFCRVNEYGFLETPYYKVKNGQVTDEIEYLSADTEAYHKIAQANSKINDKKEFVNNIISSRFRDDFPFCVPTEVDYMDVDPMQLVSVSTSLIPFLEHDDANRALMGSNMQKQAVPLLITDLPYVGTGMEKYAAYDSRGCVVPSHDGVVVNTTADKITVQSIDEKACLLPDQFIDYKLIKFSRSNQSTCINQIVESRLLRAECKGVVTKITKTHVEIQDDSVLHKIPLTDAVGTEFLPLVAEKEEITIGKPIVGERVSAPRLDKDNRTILHGSVLADGQAMENGRLALGKNILVAFMPWEGYNFEDAILVSERMIKDDIYTSIHIDEYEIQARETKLGPEQITRDIPNLSDRAFRDLDEEGIIRIGAHVESHDILVGMISAKGETDLSPEYKLLYSIFGEKAREVKDSSLRLPNGSEGTVIDIKKYSREAGDDLPPGVEKVVKVYVVTKRKLQVGDKMAGRHGNKGVISRIMPEYEMPFMEDGTPIDIVLNPLGVPSRMNIGQILETQLGFVAKKLGVSFELPIFSHFSPEAMDAKMAEANLPQDCKFRLYDGRTGESFENKVFCGYIYMMKLAHLAADKMHARSTGPYSLVTQQPLGGKAQFGGQRLGEMEVWALEAYGASHTLQELLTVKSDDMLGRARIYEAIIKGLHSVRSGIPESFNVLLRELRGLVLDVVIYNNDNEEINLEKIDKNVMRIDAKNSRIKLGTLERG